MGRHLCQVPTDTPQDELAVSTGPIPGSTGQCDPEMFAGPPGGDVEDWLESCDQSSFFTLSDDATKLLYVAFYITKVSATWFPKRARDFLVWSSFNEQLRQFLGTPTVHSVVGQKQPSERIQHLDVICTLLLLRIITFGVLASLWNEALAQLFL